MFLLTICALTVIKPIRTPKITKIKLKTVFSSVQPMNIMDWFAKINEKQIL